MTRTLTALVLFAALASAAALFKLKHEVERLETALAVELRAMHAEREAIEVLEAEWSYLNRPERISRLAREELGLGEIAVAQTIALDDLPGRGSDGAVPLPAGRPLELTPAAVEAAALLGLSITQ